MKTLLSFLSAFLLTSLVLGQDHLPLDYLPAEFHKNRREAFRKLMPPNSVAVFFANPVQNRSNDVDYVFHQDPNLYYLSGYKEPNGLLVIFSEPQKEGNSTFDEVLFVQERDPQQEQWTGYRLGPGGAKESLGFETAYVAADFLQDKIKLGKFDQILLSQPVGAYTDRPNNPADSYDLFTYFKNAVQEVAVMKNQRTDNDLPHTFSSKVNTAKMQEIMAGLRQIKTAEELALMRKAIKMAAIAQVEVMKAMHPQMSELEIQGIHEFVYRKYGSEAEGYPSIVGAGANGCVLHYIENNRTQVGDQLVLMDVGAEYHGYSADVTRTIPANGTFTEAQRSIYNLVLRAQDAAIAQAVVGNDFSNLEKSARQIINHGLMELGIIEKPEEGRRYFPHSVGHYLGLDVHDLSLGGKFQPNMVITVEPGIYIPPGSDCHPKWHGIAVRIEDDILITENGPVNLSVDAPRSAEDIETVMRQKSVLNQLVLPDLDSE